MPRGGRIKKPQKVGHKYCSDCLEFKLIKDFSKDKNSYSGLVNYCKPCAYARYKIWRESKLDEVRRKDRIKHYTRKYGLEEQVAEALVDNRTGICEICQSEDLLVVDHNHVTKQVRGFICSSCNSGLGYAKENKKILNQMICYLDKYNV